MTAASMVDSSCSSHSIDSMSRWFVGSSRRSRSGPPERARASDARVSSPPESVSGAWSPPAIASSSRRSSRSVAIRSAAPERACSRSVKPPRRGGRWSWSATRAPFSQASSPPASSVSPIKARRSVVLPAPFGPASASRSRRSTLKETPSNSGSPESSFRSADAIRTATPVRVVAGYPRPVADDATIQKRSIDMIRALAMDAVQKANAGHPGTAMALAPLAYVLYRRVMRHNPTDPHWPNRDRFVLSAGHAAMLQYAVLHLTGYNLSLEELKRFRQWQSRTPGHPEHFVTEGVETTTGPLGQGLANGVR